MALIYAFQDAAGHWHGDLDTPLLDTDPGHGTLTYLPVAGTPEADSPFAGQTLSVLFGVTDLDPGPVTYQLDDGGRFAASWPVHLLLATPMGSQAAPEPAGPPADDHTPEPWLEMTLTDGGRHYVLTATRHDDGHLTASLMACTPGGDIQGELRGDIDMAHLTGLARLLDAAASTTPTPAATPAPRTAPAPAARALPAPRRGESWTDEEKAQLADRYRHQPDFAALGREFGRSAKAIQYQLAGLGLARRPAVPQPAAPPVPAPRHTDAPTLDERRQIHRRSHENWSDEEEQQLAQLCAQGVMADELSREFGRSETAIETRLKRINAQGPAADKARMHDF